MACGNSDTSTGENPVESVKNIQSTISKNNNKKWKTLRKGSFAIDYPAEWQLDVSGSNRTAFIAFAPQANPASKFKENINLMINDISSFNYTMEQFVKISERQIQDIFLKPKIISSETSQKDGGDVHTMIYLGTMNNVEIQYRQQYQIKNGKSYILTYSADPQEYDRYSEIAQQSFNSFEIKE